MVHSVQRKGFSDLADVRVGVNGSSLRLQFSTRIARQFFQKDRVYKGLGRSDNPDNRQWAEDVARRIQRDIDHPDGLFDPTLQKYLEIKSSSTVALLPSAKAQPKLGEVWNEFVEYKFKTGQIAETTYLKIFQGTWGNYLKPYKEEYLDSNLAERILSDLSSNGTGKKNLKDLLNSLSEMCRNAIKQDKITKDYFADMGKNIKSPKKSKQQSEEEDYKAFSREERDVIIEAFKSSHIPLERHAASLVEFLFLTGCRTGEALALQWKDIKLERGWIVFNKSYDSTTRITKCTKTEVPRFFKVKGLKRLTALLSSLPSSQPDDLVFKTITGKQYSRANLYAAWKCRTHAKREIIGGESRDYQYDGVVSRLAKEGKINNYLKPYATRHTFITLQASRGIDLKLLADNCGTSVDMIYNHYLDIQRDSAMSDI